MFNEFERPMFNRRPRQENPLTDWSSIQQMIKLTDAKGAAYYSQGGGGGGGGGKLTYEQNFRKPDEPGEQIPVARPVAPARPVPQSGASKPADQEKPGSAPSKGGFNPSSNPAVRRGDKRP